MVTPKKVVVEVVSMRFLGWRRRSMNILGNLLRKGKGRKKTITQHCLVQLGKLIDHFS